MPEREKFDLTEAVGKLIRANLRPIWGLNKVLVVLLEQLKANDAKQNSVPPRPE